MKKSRRGLVAGLAVCMFLLIVFGSLLMVINQQNCWQEEHTAEYTAAVVAAEVSQTASSLYVNIHTAEPQRHLYIMSAVSSQIETAPIEALKPGDVITYRALRADAEPADPLRPVEIGALTIGDDVIFTLAERNAAMQHAAQPTNTAAQVLLGVLACAAAICGAALCRRCGSSRADAQ